MVAVTEFMDFMWSYITECLQNGKSLTIFEDFLVQGQGLVVKEQGLVVRGQGLEVQGQWQGLVNWSSRILAHNNTG